MSPRVYTFIRRKRRSDEEPELRKATKRNRTKPQKKVFLAKETDVDEHYMGAMTVKCSECGALHFKDERPATKTSFGDCCAHGKVLIDWDTSDFPEDLKSLFLRRHELSQQFLEWIRNYNSAMSFASINCKQSKPTRGRAPYVFRIHGQLYSLFNTAAHPYQLSGGGQAEPSYGQLYVVDTSLATSIRMKNKANEKLSVEVMSLLGRVMAECSPHAEAYKMLHAVEEEVTREAVDEAERLGLAEPEVPEVMLCFRFVCGFRELAINSRFSEKAAIAHTTCRHRTK